MKGTASTLMATTTSRNAAIKTALAGENLLEHGGPHFKLTAILLSQWVGGCRLMTSRMILPSRTTCNMLIHYPAVWSALQVA